MQVPIDRSYTWVLLGSGTGRDKASCACICHHEEIWLHPVCYFVSVIVLKAPNGIRLKIRAGGRVWNYGYRFGFLLSTKQAKQSSRFELNSLFTRIVSISSLTQPSLSLNVLDSFHVIFLSLPLE